MYTKEQSIKVEIPDVAAPIQDENGNVAMRYYQTIRVLTKCGPTEYIFDTQANICMAWINPADVSCILGKRGGCCGQKRPGVFSYANSSNVRQWTNRGGR
jgi:hypothetical protein